MGPSVTVPCIDYTELPDLNTYYFEDSYVLEIKDSPSELDLRLDLVLTPQHSSYRPPPPDQQYCFWRATLRFPGVRQARWIERHDDPAIDATGESDLGNIDQFLLCGGAYRLSGTWGIVEIESDLPHVILESEKEHSPVRPSGDV
jgi:hypothetical protein